MTEEANEVFSNEGAVMKFKATVQKVLMISTLLTAHCYADSSVGCGLGSMIFKENSLLSSSARVTTNQISLTQYLGVTSGTSGCSRHDIVLNEQSHVHFAEINLKSLSIDMAKGHGEYLVSFAQTLGCKDQAADHFAEVTRVNFSKIFPNRQTNAQEMLNNLGQALREDSQLKHNCLKANLI